jgi:tripartite-type tricarboxylate transporter receptor subunit TctC
MPTNRRMLILAIAVGAVLPGQAFAQDDYPSRPIELVVPFPAAGATDVIARLAAQIARSGASPSLSRTAAARPAR